MKLFIILTLIFIILTLTIKIAMAETIYRCGNSYQYEPCKSIAKILHYTPMTAQQKRVAEEAQQRLTKYEVEQYRRSVVNKKLLLERRFVNAHVVLANAADKQANYQLAVTAMTMKHSQLTDDNPIMYTEILDIRNRFNLIAEEAIK
jgi:hypothetical protein